MAVEVPVVDDSRMNQLDLSIDKSSSSVSRPSSKTPPSQLLDEHDDFDIDVLLAEADETGHQPANGIAAGFEQNMANSAAGSLTNVPIDDIDTFWDELDELQAMADG